MRYTWLTQGGFLFESNGTRLLIDPYMSDYLELNHKLTRLKPFPLAMEELRPDWMFCTHDHLDHFDPETVEAIAQAYPTCCFAGPQSCYDHYIKCGISPESCLQIDLGESAQLGEFGLCAVPAFHSDPHSVGAVIETGDKRVYLSGDSNYSTELVNERTHCVDAVFICINGKLNNMNDAHALRVVESIGPDVALPMHYGLFAENTAEPQAFIDACKQLGIESFAMNPGQGYEL